MDIVVWVLDPNVVCASFGAGIALPNAEKNCIFFSSATDDKLSRYGRDAMPSRG